VADPDEALVLRSRVAAQHDGLTLLAYLTQRFRYLDRDGWQRRIVAGDVRVDDAPGRPAAALRAGSVVSYRRTDGEPWVDRRVHILHRDAAVVAADKPAHLPAHADGPFVLGTLVAIVRTVVANPALDLVHRLDRETSGVCLLAATKAAARHLRQQFAAGTVQKVYHAVVSARIDADFVVDAPIGQAKGSLVTLRRAVGTAAIEPRPAITNFFVERRTASGTLLRCEPRHGRTHQIRVHLEAHGTPLVGDKLYGRPDADYLAFVQHVKASGDVRTFPSHPDRHLLHASRLGCRHPTTDGDMTVASPLPPAFAQWLDAE
jgi:RluA family pseudouridine synthase